MKKKLYSPIVAALIVIGTGSVFAQHTTSSVLGSVQATDTGKPLELVSVVVQSMGSGTATTSGGTFQLAGLPNGPITLTISQLGYRARVLRFTLRTDTTLVVQLAPESLALPDVTVTAREEPLGSSSRIGRSAIEHVQPASLRDVLQLLPGQLAQNPTLGGPQQILLRQVTTSPGGVRDPQAEAAQAAGTAIILDGAPISNNANLQTDLAILNSSPGAQPAFASVAGRGLDLRQVPADNIEEVEVIRGVPSARHGDLTAGAVLVTTRAGAYRPELRLRLNPTLAQVSAGGGRRLAGRAGVVSASADFTTATADTRRPEDRYRRLTGQLTWSRAVGAAETFRTTTSVGGFLTRDGYQTAASNVSVRRADSDEHQLRLNTRGTWQPLDRKFRLAYTVSATTTTRDSYKEERVTRDLFPVTTATRDTTMVAEYGQSDYLSKLRVQGRETNLYGRLEGQWRATTGPLTHRLLLGSEWRTDANQGPGRQFDVRRPPRQNYRAGDRPRSYHGLPALHQVAYYVEDQVVLPLGAQELTLQGGLRFDNVGPRSPWAGRFGGPVLAPRLNAGIDLLPGLRARAGYGHLTKAPTFNFLYPGLRYIDLVNFSYYATNPAERLVVMTTHILDATLTDYRPVQARKQEIGLDWHPTTSEYQLAITGFRETTTGAYATNRTVLPLPVAVLQAAVTPPGQPPILDPHPARIDTFFAAYDRPARTQYIQTVGVEFVLETPELPRLGTSVQLSGAWLRTRSRDESSLADADRVLTGTTVPERVPVYPGGSSYRTERFSTSLRLVQRLPTVGCVITGLVQTVWWEQNQLEPVTPLPSGYVNRDGLYIPLGPAEQVAPENADLQRPVNNTYTQPERLPALWLLSLRVSKEFRAGTGLAFYANNVPSSRPAYVSPRTGAYRRRNEPLFFGAEFYVRL